MSADRELWLRPLLADARQGGPVPAYDSSEWHALPPKSLQRLASAAIAGECWARWWDDLPQRLEDEFWATAEFEGAELRREIAVAAWTIGRVPKFYEYHASRVAAGYIPRRHAGRGSSLEPL